ncbi:MAG: CotH kinase family protein, partial [Defluviitaleaceae bacterium]|nr:CotH kinase family protein [Defluviitaleaceae bacterium]
GYEYPAAPANFNRRGRESERPVHVEMFDHTGELHISQRAGFRVRGGFSRAADQKSLELYAREEYGDRNNFRFAFFDDEFTYDGELIDRYRRVRLRNGGSDRYAGFIRDELGQSLFRQAGMITTQTHRPAAVFLNGEYYGAAWLKSPRTENHLSRIFGGDSSNFDMVEGGDRRLGPAWWEGEERARRDMREVSELAMRGFTGVGGEERFEEFSRRVDVDDLILYYAMQIIINNYDWPNHNMELWRYFPTAEELRDPTLHPYLRDGRWRVFAHDIESGWAMWDDDNIMAREDTLRDILLGENDRRWNSGYSSAFLYAFVNYEPTREQLANTFEELISGVFSPQNVIRTLDDLIAQIENEHNHAIRAGIVNPDNPGWPNADHFANSREAIRRFARIRPTVVEAFVQRHLR